MKNNHNQINKLSLNQSNKHKKPNKWHNKQEGKLKMTEKAEINSKMNNWEIFSLIKPYQKPKEKNKKKDYCSEKLPEMFSKAQDSLSTYLSKDLEHQNFSLKFQLHNKSPLIFTLMSLKITLMWEQKILSKNSQSKFTFTRTIKESFMRENFITKVTLFSRDRLMQCIWLKW